MITIPELAAESLGSYLTEHMGRRFGATDAALIELVPSAARLALVVTAMRLITMSSTPCSSPSSVMTS